MSHQKEEVQQLGTVKVLTHFVGCGRSISYIDIQLFITVLAVPGNVLYLFWSKAFPLSNLTLQQ